MDWSVIAQALLDAAKAAVSVDRALVAPGPDFGRDCRMLAVHLEQPQTRPVAGDLGGRCATAPVLVWRVTFVADCLPVFGGDDGSPPAPDAISSWSKTFLADCQKIQRALSRACTSGAIGDCKTVTLGDGTPTGPTGQTATMSWPITVRDFG